MNRMLFISQITINNHLTKIIINLSFHNNNPDTIKTYLVTNHATKHSHKTNSNYNLINHHIITFIIIIITINNQATTTVNPLPTSHKPLNYQ